MPIIVFIIAIIAIAGTLLFAGCRNNLTINQGVFFKIEKPITIKKMKSMTRKEVTKMLENLENSDVIPPAPTSFAMCYRPAPKRIFTFDDMGICPDCKKDSPFLMEIYEAWEKEIDICNELIAALREEAGLDISLDVINLCRTCDDNGNRVSVKFRIKYSDGYVHETKIFSSDPLIFMRNFFTGKTKDYEPEFNIKDNKHEPYTKENVRYIRNLIGAYENKSFFSDKEISKIVFGGYSPEEIGGVSLTIYIGEETLPTDKIALRIGDSIGVDKQFVLTEIDSYYVTLQKNSKNSKGEKIKETIILERYK